MNNGYINMDHAGWMQSHIASCRRARIKLHPSTPETLTEFQRKVINIIGIVGGGIYNVMKHESAVASKAALIS